MKTFLIISLALILAGPVLCQRVLIRTCRDLNECPTNYPVQVQDAGSGTAVTAGFDSNWTWAAYYQALPGFDQQWTNWQATNQSSQTYTVRTNFSNLQQRQTLLLSNVMWYATNAMTPLNATLGASNAFLLRAIEERLKQVGAN